MGADLDNGRVGALDGGRVEAREEGTVADGVALGEDEGLGTAVGQLWVQPPDLQWAVGRVSADGPWALASDALPITWAEASWRPELLADGPHCTSEAGAPEAHREWGEPGGPAPQRAARGDARTALPAQP